MTYQAGPFDSAHWYVQWGGKLPGSEQWSCGLRIAQTSAGGTPANDPAQLTAITNAIKAYHQNASTGISPRALLSFVKVNVVDTNGHYRDQVTYQTTLADIPGGSSLVAQTPANQVCLAVSLTTGYSRGPAHRGRFYLPLPCYGLDASGQIGTAAATQTNSTTTTLLAAINAYSSNAKVAVFSRKLGAPAHRIVTGSSVGLVLDTQRRRRASQLENYQGQNV